MKSLFLSFLMVSVLWSATSARAELAPGADFITTEKMKACAACLHSASGYGVFDFEVAAWIRQKPDGELWCEIWPSTGGHWEQKWTGVVPSDVQGILHTHPREADYRPSEGDRQTAKRKGFPVFAVTYMGVYGYYPSVNKTLEVTSFKKINTTLKEFKKAKQSVCEAI